MADERCWRVEEDGAGARLDAYITERTELTRSRVAALIEEGQALVNGRAAGKAGLRLRAGDEVRLCVPEAREAGVEAQNIDLRVVYEDSDLAVVFKPSGMVVHPAAGNPDGTLVNALLYHLDGLSGIGGEKRPGLVHRIDKDTSGLCWWPRTTAPTCRWRSRSGNTRWSAPIWPSASAIFGKTWAWWTRPSAAIPPTARRWPSAKAGGAR